MRFKLDPVDVPLDDPFKHDVLERSDSIKSLTNFLSNINGPFVLAIDSGWGTGKTTFLKMWKAQLEQLNTTCVYLNAWENDFASDPLIAFLGEIQSISDSIDDPGRAALSKAKRAGTILAKRLIPTAVKVATLNTLDVDEITEQLISEGLAEGVSDAIDVYATEKSVIQELKSSLTKVVESLVVMPVEDSEDRSLNETSNNVIIFVDELDRCRPTFAIELLERIKHLFDIPNLMFVLAVDKSQLGESLKSVYGAGMDANEYLKRFIDLEFPLPEPDSSRFTTYLFDAYDFTEIFNARAQYRGLEYEKDTITRTFSELVDLFGMSLRAREQCFARIRIAYFVSAENQHLFPQILIPLIVLKSNAPAIYTAFAHNNAETSVVAKYLRSLPGGSDFMDSRAGVFMEAYLMVSRSAHYEPTTEIKKLTEYVNDERNSSDARARELQEAIGHVNRQMDHLMTNGALRHVVEKIEIASKFM